MNNQYLEDIILEFLLDKCPEKAIKSSIEELIAITLESSHNLESRIFEQVILDYINWSEIKDNLEIANNG